MTKIHNILIVPDKFKGSLSAAGVADALEAAVRRCMVGGGQAKVVKLPMADGGDGSMEVVEAALGSACGRVMVDTFDALMRPIQAPLLLFDGGRQAFIEMAKVCGLAMLTPEECNPEKTTTYGLGLLIAEAVKRGCEKIVIGIGGSATNDGGEGLMRAIEERAGERWPGGAISVPRGECPKATRVLIAPQKARPEIVVACDVDNPLLGPNGATMVYGPQKGADAAMLERLERRMERWAEEAQLNTALPGGGAAGGVGAALARLGARLTPGWQLFGEMAGLEQKIAEADFILTGEGRFDGQSLDGKLISGILSLSKKYKKKPVVVCGRCTLPASVWKKAGIADVYALSEIEPDAARSMSDASALLSGVRTRVAGCDEAGRFQATDGSPARRTAARHRTRSRRLGGDGRRCRRNRPHQHPQRLDRRHAPFARQADGQTRPGPDRRQSLFFLEQYPGAYRRQGRRHGTGHCRRQRPGEDPS